MADNVDISAGAGTTIATDQVGAVHYQIVKAAFGALDTATLVTPSAGLPVAQQGAWTVQPGNTANTTAWLVTGTGGTFPATQSGAWNIANVSGTISLPTGASTAARQPALGTAGTASADVISVQGIASMTAVKVDGSAVTQPVSGTVTANVGTPGSLALDATLTGGTQKAKLVDTGGTNVATVSAGGALKVDGSAATQPVSGTVAVTQSTAANLKVDPSGVTSPVSLAALPALAAGTALVGKASVGQDTASLYSGTTALTPKFAAISTAASGLTTVVAAVASKKIRVLSYRFQADADVSVKFRDNTAAVDLTGAMATGAKGGGGGAAFSPVGHFETAAGNALSINLSGATQTSGHLTYLEI